MPSILSWHGSRLNVAPGPGIVLGNLPLWAHSGHTLAGCESNKPPGLRCACRLCSSGVKLGHQFPVAETKNQIGRRILLFVLIPLGYVALMVGILATRDQSTAITTALTVSEVLLFVGVFAVRMHAKQPGWSARATRALSLPGDSTLRKILLTELGRRNSMVRACLGRRPGDRLAAVAFPADYSSARPGDRMAHLVPHPVWFVDRAGRRTCSGIPDPC